MKTVSTSVTAWLTSSHGLQDLADDRTDAQIIDVLGFYSGDMESSGWVRVGTAEITVTLVENQQVVDNKVSSLKKELELHRAKSYVIENAILEQISNLLSITYKPESEASHD